MSFLDKLLQKQLPLIPKERKLTESDFKKISKNLDNNIEFGGRECNLWKGVFCNKGKTYKGVYVNYYFQKKKNSLHRLLYENYINKLNERDYLVHVCNEPLCLNPNHIRLKKDKLEEQKKDNYKINFFVSF